MHFKATSAAAGSDRIVVNLRCPECRQRGTFEQIASDLRVDAPGQGTFHTGQRRCPDPKCATHIFFVKQGTELVATYPAERIDFDANDVPLGVISALKEAITCHASECYVASAIMIRKTLEELCAERESGGDNLQQRIQNLRAKLVIPEELLDGLDDIRLLGNDAAHIDSRTYDDVGKEEVEVAIDFTKEVLKAAYQYKGLLARIRSLKKPT